MIGMIRAGGSGFACSYHFALPDNFTANCWWRSLAAKREQSALYQPAIMGAGGDFLADITSFFKINSGWCCPRLVMASASGRAFALLQNIGLSSETGC